MIELHWGRDHREPSRCRRIGQSSQHPPGLDIIVLGTGPGRARLIVIWPRAVGTTTRGKHPDREELMTERPATPRGFAARPRPWPTVASSSISTTPSPI